ncbi:phosphotransferase [Tumebacillus permanentifrigoris]|uniref:CotS family spore coat protein n=1 Tax=Tumebacillus permanentifrigoris TaxID=378543 RepID=A0A316D7N6_9BACL|nr:phosphotransferase [Tumebacillus permanentifrigoris]PWK11319.1 CotS family spore coat protein [Tumebacillus permanentifrigoris]
MEQWERLLGANWGLEVQRLEAVGPVFKVSTSTGIYCLKRGKHGRGRLGFDHHVIEELYAQGFSATPRFCLTVEGKPWAEIDDEPWVLTPWIGRPLNASSQVEWLRAAAQLARFHQASHGLEMPDEVKRVAFSGKWLARFEERNSALRAAVESFSPPQNEFEADVGQHATKLLEEAERATRTLHRSAYGAMVHAIRETPTLIHGNVKAENFTVDEAGRVCLIDFDSFRLDVWVQDLSDFLANALLAQGWSQEFACHLFEAYHAERPLLAEEAPVLLALLSYPYRAVKVIHKYHAEGRGLEKTLRKWRRALQELNSQKVFVNEWAIWLEKRVQ